MKKKQENSLLAVNALSSGTAGLIARFLCHPIDTLKAKLQITNKRGLGEMIKSTLKNEGIAGFYQGIGAVLLGGVPGVCVYITTYDLSKERLLSHPLGANNPVGVYLFSGILAEAVW